MFNLGVDKHRGIDPGRCRSSSSTSFSIWQKAGVHNSACISLTHDNVNGSELWKEVGDEMGHMVSRDLRSKQIEAFVTCPDEISEEKHGKGLGSSFTAKRHQVRRKAMMSTLVSDVLATYLTASVAID